MIGHSLGAAICLTFAIRYGDAAAAVVPVGGGLKMAVNPIILEGLRKDPGAIIALAGKLSVAKPNREQLCGVFGGESLPGRSRDHSRRFLRMRWPGYRRRRSGGVRIPTMVICGADDKMTPPSLSQCIRDGIRRARLTLIEGAGHFVMLENPAAFNTTLADFVNSVASAFPVACCGVSERIPKDTIP